MTDTEKRDMLVRLARDLMGWRYWDGKDDAPETIETLFTDAHSTGWLDVYEHASFNPTRHWNPLENIADAWMVLQAMTDRIPALNAALTTNGHQFGCFFINRTWGWGRKVYDVPDHGDPNLAAYAMGETMPLAICLAAIAVLDAGGAS